MKILTEPAKRIVFWLYLMMFGKRPGPVAKKFIKNLGYVTAGVGIAKFLSLAFQIYIGQSIGPEEYGKFSLISSVSNFLWVPMMMGTGTAMVKYLSERRGGQEAKEIFSVGILLIVVFFLASTLVLYIFADSFSAAFSVRKDYFLAAVFLANSYCVWAVSEKILQGFESMKRYSVMSVVFGTYILSASIAFSGGMKDFLLPFVVMASGYMISLLFILPEIKKNFTFSINRKWASVLLTYAFIGIPSSFSNAIVANINKIFMNVYLTFEDIGLYQAYYFSTVSISAAAAGIFVIVFFPFSSSYKDKRALLRTINKPVKFSPLLFLLFMALSETVLHFYGSEYPKIFLLEVLFSLAAIATLINFVYLWYASSLGIRGIKISTISGVSMSVISITMAYLLIPQMGIYGAAYGLLVSGIVGCIITYWMIMKLWKQSPTKTKSPEKIQDDEYENPYHWKLTGFSNFIYTRRIETFKEMLGDSAGSVLDVGCGDGRVSCAIADVSKKVTGIDTNPRAIGFAKGLCKKTNVVFFGGDFRKVKFRKKFDAVLMIDFIEHLQKNDAAKSLEKAKCVLKHGGILIVSTPAKKPWRKIAGKHYYEYGCRELEKLIVSGGFDITKKGGDFLYFRGIGKLFSVPLLSPFVRIPVILGERIPCISQNIIISAKKAVGKG